MGSELLTAVIKAFKIMEGSQAAHLQIFCGPYCDEKIYEALQKYRQDNITIERFTDHFPEWLEAADLSISMAGYNTCMNLIQAGTPALVYPFKQNREQRLRAQRLSKKVPIVILEDTDLTPRLLSKMMVRQLDSPHFLSDIKLNGAEDTARQLELWYAERSLHD